MEFCSKLDFLMNLTQMKNKDLAAEIAVDRSLISLLRSGKRGMPKNKLHIRRMAGSFSRHIVTDFQRQALAEMSGFPGMRTRMSAEILELQLERWLLGDSDIVDNILDGIKQDAAADWEITPPKITAPEGETFFFYGSEGKREALRFIMANVKEGMIGIFDNTDLDWLVSDPVLSAETQAVIMKLLGKGSTITHIIPSISEIVSYTDSLRFMLPIYTRGNVNVYYYPRIVDMVRKLTLIVAPGQCVSYSYGSHSESRNLITTVSTNKEYINAHAEQFREYLSQCRSALTVHREPREFFGTVSDFYTPGGDIIQKLQPLSTASMPAELALLFAEQTEDPVWKYEFRRTAELLPSIEKRMARYRHIDISPLSSVKDIAAGKVPVACPHPNGNCPCYTPETYIMHLKNIIRLIDTYEGYTFIPVAPEEYFDYDLMVNEGGLALLPHRSENSPMIMEFRRPEIVLACREHLMRIVDKAGFSEAARGRTKAKLGALIAELEKTTKSPKKGGRSR
ncbi:MAG: hypothetical protein ACI4XA_02735 [Oscillospiraceae bacterium]